MYTSVRNSYLGARRLPASTARAAATVERVCTMIRGAIVIAIVIATDSSC